MFDVTPEDISRLNDTDLRELVARLCEAELVCRELSPVAVTWGGNQTAPDGGLDVRVALPPEASIEGFIPRVSTGFQVKKPDMQGAKIIAEMRPKGAIRPVIQKLADEAGAYIIVSSTGSTADGALSNRQNALREALDGVSNADQLYTDFYDRTRLATWVRCHAGLVVWVRTKVGRALSGWQPYGAWSGDPLGAETEYLLDDKLRLHLGDRRDASGQSIIEVMDELRDELAQPGKILRLVGLSGVGKTRLVQALFETTVGARPLPADFAVYTNLSDDPDPQPIGLASDLIANRKRAILIVDNCPPDLHGRLAKLCQEKDSTLSVLTVEYDVREDQPEGTQVVTLDTSSPELIEKLVHRGYPHLSQVDARTIADVSGGNARIAIALAVTVARDELISSLTSDELFQRLFRQRHEHDNALLLAAQACSLVYSFQGEALESEEAELPRLATLVGQSSMEIYRHVSELLRRNLVQQRGVWRAVLPHALANWLAKRALESIPLDVIERRLLGEGAERLARSFSRRLAYLHDHPTAVAIVDKWLAPSGLLGNVCQLNGLGQAMLENIAPVSPEATLAALERVKKSYPDKAAEILRRHHSLLHSLAYDSALFERSVSLLSLAAAQSGGAREDEESSRSFFALFRLSLSGTHASIEQRVNYIEALLTSHDPTAQSLGLAAIGEALNTEGGMSFQRFDFGARSRNFGYEPRTRDEVIHWYASVLALMERLSLTEGMLKIDLRSLLAKNFRGLWVRVGVNDQLESLLQRLAVDGFWRGAWLACRKTIRRDRDRMTSEAALRVFQLEELLKPKSRQDQVRAFVLGDSFDLEEIDEEGESKLTAERLETMAHGLGIAIADDATAFVELMPELLHGGRRAFSFGRGFAAAASNLRATWSRLLEGLEEIVPEKRDVQLLKGILAELWEQDRDLAQTLLDMALDHPMTQAFTPELHSSLDLDERGVERLSRALSTGYAGIRTYMFLAYGRSMDHLAGSTFKKLLLLIADQSDGVDVAVDILHMRFFRDRSDHIEHDPELIMAGRELLRRITFGRHKNQNDDYRRGELVHPCLVDPDASPVAAEIAAHLKTAMDAYQTYWIDNNQVLEALFKAQPRAVLDVFVVDAGSPVKRQIRRFDAFGEHHSSPADHISCETLVGWCDDEPEPRYAFAAGLILFALPANKGGSGWSDQARALLANAPEPIRVLEVFIERFRPMSWSGSLAALMESRARLLDNLGELVPPGLMPYVVEVKARLAQEISRVRQRETEQDRTQDERFE